MYRLRRGHSPLPFEKLIDLGEKLWYRLALLILSHFKALKANILQILGIAHLTH